MLARAGAIWLVLLVVAIANGAVREAAISPRIGAPAAHVISTVTLSAAILVLTWILLPWIGVRRMEEAWTVGLLWLTLTLAFEFLAGHYLFGTPWSRIVADYNLLKGRVWIFVPLVTVLAPVWMARIRIHI